MTIDIHDLFGVGIAILIGLLGGKLAHRFRVPRVTGYLVLGLIIGPSVTGLITDHITQRLDVINEIALGLILFAIGNEFEWTHLKRVGLKALGRIALFETLGVFVLVCGGFLLLGFNLSFSLLAATAGIATAPAATLLVVREYHTRGPLTDRLLALVAINNIISLALFRVVRASMLLEHEGDLLTLFLAPIYEFFVSLVLGYLLGKILSAWERHLDDLSELLLVIIGLILLGTGLANMLMLSPMIVALAMGATVTNSSRLHKLIYVEQRSLEQPLYIAFFVFAGTSLHLNMLPQMGIAGVVYLLARALGKIGGVWVAGRFEPEKPQIGKYLGMTMLCQAGVAIGEAYEVAQIFPETGRMLTTIVVATVVINETLGPWLVRVGLAGGGEVPSETERRELEGIETPVPRMTGREGGEEPR